MEQYFKILKDRLDKKTEKVSKSNLSEFEKNEQCKMILLEHYRELQSFEETYSFKNEHEDIRYFKHLKPQILSELMYCNKITKMIHFSQLPCLEISEKHLNYELKKVSDFYETHIEFISYMNSDLTFSDESLFLRKNVNLSAIPSYLLLREDAKQITNGGHLVVKLLLNTKLYKFIQNKLNGEPVNKNGITIKSDFLWTAPKSALIEVIYALYYKGVINNGSAEIKQLVHGFEVFFNVELGDPYRHFVNIKQRKKTTATFLESLTDSLIKHMNEQDSIP
ncbi:MAG: hypothetical protein E6Q89_02930 [Bacteroidia bacterium]|nr:MAG: hypothetical protein E6Q89_02930 [Bacteroidia bacterium]